MPFLIRNIAFFTAILLVAESRASVLSAHGRSQMLITGPRIVVEYNRFELKCMTTKEHRNGTSWYFSPNGSHAEHELLQLDPDGPVRTKANGTVLYFRPVTKSHAGSYRCCNVYNLCANMSLYVLSVVDDTSKLFPVEDSGGVLEVTREGTFAVGLHYAPFRGSVYADSDGQVPFCHHFRALDANCEETRTDTSMTYFVHNATMISSGLFHLKLVLNKRLEEFRLRILIKGSPVVNMDQYDVLLNTNHVNLYCRASAFPAPVFSFSYTPCLPTAMHHLPNVDRTFCGNTVAIPANQVSPANYTIKFDAVLPAWAIRQPGIVRCEAVNSEGTASSETALIIRNSPESMSLQINSPTDVVLYGDTVNISCQADVYNFTDKFVLRHGGAMVPDVLVSEVHYAWVATYRTNIVNTSQNDVSCQVLHRNGSTLTRDLNLSIKYPSKPHILSGNDTIHETLGYGEHLTLECDITGTPTPEIEWFKRDILLGYTQTHRILVSLDLDEEHVSYRCVGNSRLGSASKTWHIALDDSSNWLLIGSIGFIASVALLLIPTMIWAVSFIRQIAEKHNELVAMLQMPPDCEP